MHIKKIIFLYVFYFFSTISIACSAETVKKQSLNDLYKKTDNVVVFISAGGKVQGSGVLVKNENLLSPDADGTIIVTNAHVVSDHKKVSVKTNKKTEFVGTVVAKDEESDLALVQVEGINLNVATIAPSNAKHEIGDKVFAIGSPKGLSNSLSDGIISGLRETDGISMIQTTSAISKGSSGGGLFSYDGKLIGITSFKIAGGENVNFAVHIKHFVDLLEWQKVIAEGVPDQKEDSEQQEKEDAKKIVTKAHPDWEKIVESQEFKDWKTWLPVEAQRKLDTTWDPYYITEKITEYKNNTFLLECTERDTRHNTIDVNRYKIDIIRSTLNGYSASITDATIEMTRSDKLKTGRPITMTISINRETGAFSYYTDVFGVMSTGNCVKGGFKKL